MFTLKHISNRHQNDEIMHVYSCTQFSLYDGESICVFEPVAGGDPVHLHMEPGDRLIIENMQGRTSQIIDVPK